MKSLTKYLMVPSALCVILLFSCEEQKPEVHGIHTENMDKSVKASEDFFRYVNGAWLDKTEIPSDRTSWGSFNELRQNTDADVLRIMNSAIEASKAERLKDAENQAKEITYCVKYFFHNFCFKFTVTNLNIFYQVICF